MIALKVLAPPLEASADERERFQQRFLLEAKTLAGLDHPNIVTVYDYGHTEDGDLYIAMEYVDGWRFNDLLKQGRLPVERALVLVRQVCGALQYAHNRGVIHRDIKNSNVLVKRDMRGREVVKVVDFGIVKLSKGNVHLTQVGIILGSPHFMAPEQAQGKDVDHRVDIYAVGVLMYCALAGRYPFTGQHSTAILTAHLTQRPPTFKEVAPDLELPQGLETVVRRCLKKEPTERFFFIDSVITEIYTYTGPREGPTDEMSTMATAVTTARGPVWRNPLVAMGAGAMGAMLLVGVGVVAAVVALIYLQKPPTTEGVEVETPVPPIAVEEAPTAPVVVTTTRKRDGDTESTTASTGARETPSGSKDSSRSTSSTRPAATSSGSGRSRSTTSGSAGSSAASAAANSASTASSAEPAVVDEGSETEPATDTDEPAVETPENDFGGGSDLIDPWKD